MFLYLTADVAHALVRPPVPAPVLPRAKDVWRSAVAVGAAERAGVILIARRRGRVAEEERAEELKGKRNCYFIKKNQRFLPKENGLFCSF